MDTDLSNYIKYCLGYIRLTRERTVAAQQRYSVDFPKLYFSLLGLLNGDTDGKKGELINLDTFYKFDPKKVPENQKDQYEKEKVLANKIEDIYNKYRNDEFTKQIILSFGYFEIELPIVSEEEIEDEEEEATTLRKSHGDVTNDEILEALTYLNSNYAGKPVKVAGEKCKIIGKVFGKIKVELSNGKTKVVEKSALENTEITSEEAITYLKEKALEKIKKNSQPKAEITESSSKTKIDRFPLFSLPVRIDKLITKSGVEQYSLYAVDPEIQVNIGILESILKEDLYLQLLEEMGKYEIEGKLVLPITHLDTFIKIWHEIKAKLKLREANFDEDSFNLEEIKLSLSPKANYFLAEDLAKLSKFTEKELVKTSLTSWTIDDELTLEGDAPHETELYFPFLYDKYQVSTLSVLVNKASIIQGPPGTGKSETIANLLCHLAATGKKVLFVSQKAQALKVVKDKLKKINVKYLFGYLPNPNSAQTGEEDEADGIAPQLSGLGAYIQKLDIIFSRNKQLTGNPPSIATVVEKKSDLRAEISSNIEKQRRYYELWNELLSLERFDVKISYFVSFGEKFSEKYWNIIKGLKKEIEGRKTLLNSLEKDNPKKKIPSDIFTKIKDISHHKYSTSLTSLRENFLQIWDEIKITQDEILKLSEQIKLYKNKKEKINLDKLFLSLDPKNSSFINDLEIFKEDISKTAYDRHFNLLRKFNNFKRNIRLKNNLHKIPREVVDYIDKYLDQDISRTEARNFLVSLCDYFRYYKNTEKLENEKTNLLKLLNDLYKKHEQCFVAPINSIIQEHICHINTSQDSVLTILTTLVNYFSYHEKYNDITLEKENIENEHTLNLDACGLSNEECLVLENIIDGENPVHPELVKKNILRIQEIKDELRNLANGDDLSELSKEIKSLEIDRSKRISLYLQNIVNANVVKKWQHGIKIKQVVAKLARAFGKSKKAFKTFDKLRKEADNFNAVLDLIPIWIMELDDASRIVPLEPGIFDYVILDEASQCNVAYTLPVMFRSDRTLFVGDSEQMRDSTVMFKSNKIFDELAHRYKIPEERQIKCTGSSVQSVLDIAKNRGFMFKTLQYHYRSPQELIGFSNKYFYKPNGKDLIPLNSNYLTYKDTNRVMLIHEVYSDWKEEFSDKVNVAEARAILGLFKDIQNDIKYQGKSVGILSFFNAQATFLRELFEKEGFDEERDNYKISIIEGIQGDEKDIIIYSFVIRSPEQKNKYTPLTGEGGDIKSDVNRGRVNVAFSRARLQVHCFLSLPINEIPEKIWIKKYLQYVEENGVVDFYSTEMKPFDSGFEQEFYKEFSRKYKTKYLIQNQVSSCGFRVDFVISNPVNNKKLAVECDGPTHFKNEVDEAYGIYVQSDEERQRVIETATKWPFFRIKYSDWIDPSSNHAVFFESIVDLLK